MKSRPCSLAKKNPLNTEFPSTPFGPSVRHRIRPRWPRILRGALPALLLLFLTLNIAAQPALITGDYVYQQLFSFEAPTLNEGYKDLSEPVALAVSDTMVHGIAASGDGGVFSLPRSGTALAGNRFDLHYRFSGQLQVGTFLGIPLYVPDGVSPSAMVVLGDYVYGVTADGGRHTNGVLFKKWLKGPGGYTVLRHFAYNASIPVWKSNYIEEENKHVWVLNPQYDPTAPATTDGAFPVSLILGEDGKLYGVTQAGGREAKLQAAEVPGATAGAGWGTLFRFDPETGGFATLYSFRGDDAPSPKTSVFERLK